MAVSMEEKLKTAIKKTLENLGVFDVEPAIERSVLVAGSGAVFLAV